VNGISYATIRDAVGRRSDDIIEWTKSLVRIASENRPPAGEESAAQQFIADQCEKVGLGVDVFSPEDVAQIKEHPWWLDGREYGNGRCNVVASWKGRGEGKSLLLSGHVDVAPYEPDNWKECRPYEPIVKNGRLYGRGTADMKAGLAAAYWAVRILRELGFEPAGDLLFESLVDEEFAGGNGALAARLRGYNADLAIVGEPTRMKICPACLGAFLGDMVISGKGGMPYTGSAIANPINGAARATELFAQWQDMWRQQNNHSLFEQAGQELNVLLWRIDSTRAGEFTQMGTPWRTRLSWIVWCHPGQSEQVFYEQFERYWREHAANDAALAPFDVRLERTYHYVRPWQTPTDDAAVEAVAKAMGEWGKSVEITGAPFSCDLAIYGQVGHMSAVLLGPRGDNLHGPDEWVQVDDILALTSVYAKLAADWCGSE